MKLKPFHNTDTNISIVSTSSSTPNEVFSLPKGAILTYASVSLSFQKGRGPMRVVVEAKDRDPEPSTNRWLHFLIDGYLRVPLDDIVESTKLVWNGFVPIPVDIDPIISVEALNETGSTILMQLNYGGFILE